jgi:hypothetical protein
MHIYDTVAGIFVQGTQKSGARVITETIAYTKCYCNNIKRSLIRN